MTRSDARSETRHVRARMRRIRAHASRERRALPQRRSEGGCASSSLSLNPSHAADRQTAPARSPSWTRSTPRGGARRR